MSHTPVAIIADDLTGAADTAAVFARPDRPVPVSLRPQPAAGPSRQAFAVTTESRGCSPPAASDRMAEAIRALAGTEHGLIYKKIDSNLRGNVGAEVGALRDALGQPVLVCPAFPRRGRIVVDGVVLVHSVPVAKTEMARDQQAPVRHSSIANAIGEQRPDLRLGSVTLEDLRKGALHLSTLAREHAVVIVDAETDADLAVLARAGLDLAPAPIFCGSAGLAGALARLVLADDRGGEALGSPESGADIPADADLGPVLAVLASSSGAVARQVRAAEEQLSLTSLKLDCEHFSWEEEELPELARMIEQVVAHLLAGNPALVHAVGRLPTVARPVDLVVEHLAHLAFVAVKQGHPSALLVGGGATAHAVLSVLGTAAIEVEAELLPGIAAGVTVGGHFAGRPVVLKPGAAGDDDALVYLIRYLVARGRTGNSRQEHIG